MGWGSYRSLDKVCFDEAQEGLGWKDARVIQLLEVGSKVVAARELANQLVGSNCEDSQRWVKLRTLLSFSLGAFYRSCLFVFFLCFVLLVCFVCCPRVAVAAAVVSNRIGTGKGFVFRQNALP